MGYLEDYIFDIQPCGCKYYDSRTCTVDVDCWDCPAGEISYKHKELCDLCYDDAARNWLDGIFDNNPFFINYIYDKIFFYEDGSLDDAWDGTYIRVIDGTAWVVDYNDINKKMLELK